VYRGQGVCKICGRNDSATAEAAFRARVADLGGVPLYSEWRGVKQGHHVRCPSGHDSYPWPGNLAQGGGLCRRCSGRFWDAFYVVTSPYAIKFGITSGDPRPRLSNHAQAGFVTVERLLTDLPGSIAPETEAAVISALALAREEPIRGREYFDISCLALVLDIADSFAGVTV
jgi:hypothetical protein